MAGERLGHGMLCLNRLYEIIWNSTAQQDRPQMTIRHMRFLCWITKATSTHSEFVIFTAFLLQQWLPQHASILRHTYTACLVVRLTMLWKCSTVANENGNDGVLLWERAVPPSLYVPSLYLHGPCKTNDCQGGFSIGVGAGILPAALWWQGISAAKYSTYNLWVDIVRVSARLSCLTGSDFVSTSFLPARWKVLTTSYNRGAKPFLSSFHSVICLEECHHSCVYSINKSYCVLYVQSVTTQLYCQWVITTLGTTTCFGFGYRSSSGCP